jgi:hypothetical protein
MPFSLVGDVVTLPWVLYDSQIVVRPKEAPDPWRPFWLPSTPQAPAPGAAAAK